MSSPRLFSILRRKPGLIDFITPIRNQTEGVEAYRLFTDTDPGGAFATVVTTVPRTGLVDPAVQGPQHVIQPGENVRIIFKPSTFSLPDSGFFWLKLGYVDGGGVNMLVPAPSAATLVLPPFTGPMQQGFTATAPSGVALANSLQIDLPRSMESLRIRNTEAVGGTVLWVAFDPGGPEIKVVPQQETVAWLGLVSSIFVRGAAGTAAFTATFSPAFPK